MSGARKDRATELARSRITFPRNQDSPSPPLFLVHTFLLLIRILLLPTRSPSVNNIEIRVELQSQILQLPSYARAQDLVFLFRPPQYASEMRLAVGRGCIEHILLLIEADFLLSAAFRPRCCWDLFILSQCPLKKEKRKSGCWKGTDLERQALVTLSTTPSNPTSSNQCLKCTATSNLLPIL